MNQFTQLCVDDQWRVLSLCEDHTYDQARAILAEPRPKGLALKTSRSALARFVDQHSRQARLASLIRQTAFPLRRTREEHPGLIAASILATLEIHLFKALENGTPPNLLKEFFAYHRDMHRAWLAEEKWRATRPGAQPSPQTEHPTSAHPEPPENPEPDFTWTESTNIPPNFPPPPTPEKPTDPLPAQPIAPNPPLPESTNFPPVPPDPSESSADFPVCRTAGFPACQHPVQPTAPASTTNTPPPKLSPSRPSRPWREAPSVPSVPLVVENSSPGPNLQP